MERLCRCCVVLRVTLIAGVSFGLMNGLAGHPDYRLFSVPIEVRDLPSDAEFVPLSTGIDLSELVQRVGGAGVPDERSIRLYSVGPDGSEAEEPVQFAAAAQPPAEKRMLLPSTSTSVSYSAEFAAGETPSSGRVAGDLAWIARSARQAAKQTYRLQFGVLKSGVVVQVPYPPNNFRAFDQDARATPLARFPRMQIRPQQPIEGRFELLASGEVLTAYRIGPGVEALAGTLPFRRPFFYPVNGPDGVSLTEFGKPHDPTGSHAHHYSLWIAHADVSGHDFWSERGGVIAHDGFAEITDGPVFSRFVQKTKWIDRGKTILLERRTVTAHATPDSFRALDLDLEFTSGDEGPVTFGKTSFGFLAARVTQSISPFDGGGEIINSVGDRNEQNAHLKHAAWIDQSGPIAVGKVGGIALLDHPANPHHPGGWHCRNDGWAGAAFNMDAPFVLESGKTLRLRYRILLHRGDSTGGEVARRFREFAATPSVAVGLPRALEGNGR